PWSRGQEREEPALAPVPLGRGARRINRLQAYLLQRLRFAVEPCPGTVGAGLAGDSFRAPCTPYQSPAGLPPTAASLCRGAVSWHCRSRPCRRFSSGAVRAEAIACRLTSYSGFASPWSRGPARRAPAWPALAAGQHRSVGPKLV